MSASPKTAEMDTAQMAEQVLDQVTRAGATGDLIIDEGETLSLKARDGELEEHKVSSSRIFGLRVIKDGHIGTAQSKPAPAGIISQHPFSGGQNWAKCFRAPRFWQNWR